MTALTKPRMSVDEFLTWGQEQPGRLELFNGEVFAMSREAADHNEVKGAIYAALRDSIRKRRLPCRALPDGMVVRINDTTAYEPDAQVYCGPRLPGTALEVANPVIIVEVLSPSTRRIDVHRKLADYFRLPSVMHYLIAEAAEPMIIHHARASESTILTRIVTEGAITLDPPGIELAMADVYES